jgi:hypothetical protein
MVPVSLPWFGAAGPVVLGDACRDEGEDWGIDGDCPAPGACAIAVLIPKMQKLTLLKSK